MLVGVDVSAALLHSSAVVLHQYLDENRKLVDNPQTHEALDRIRPILSPR